MRIIGGSLRGRKIEYPDSKDVRPTKDRIREAVFNVIARDVPGSRVLDLFAGSGSYGLEAYSRGALFVLFVDNSKTSCDTITSNIVKLDAGSRCEVSSSDVFGLFDEKNNVRSAFFDLIFADPPYAKGLAKKALIMINQYDILSPSGTLIIEHDSGESLPEKEGKLSLFKQKTYKNVNISYFRVK